MKSIALFSKVLFLIISMSFTVAMAEEQSNDCMAPASLEFSLSKIKFQDVDASGNITKTYTDKDACDKGLFRKTINAIDYLRTIPPVKMQDAFQTLVGKEGSLNFLLKRIQTIQFEAMTSEICTQSTGAFVTPGEGSVMHVCPLAKKTSLLVFAQILVHEARHVDGFKHVDCKQGYSQDIEFKACDETYQEQGSYGIGLGFLFQLYFGTKNEAVKQQARSEAIQDVLIHFNKAPMGLIKGGVFLDAEDSVSFYDGANETRFGSFNDEVATISFVSNIPYIYFKSGKITSYDFTRNWSLREGALAENYRKLSQQERNELLDVLTNNAEYCFLSPARVQCVESGVDKFAEFDFSQIVPQKFVSKNSYYASDIIVLGSDGKSYQLPASKGFADAKESDLPIRKGVHLYPEVTSYAEMENGSVIGISAEGYMMEKSKGSTKFTRAKAFGDYKFKKILPYKWSKRLESL